MIPSLTSSRRCSSLPPPPHLSPCAEPDNEVFPAANPLIQRESSSPFHRAQGRALGISQGRFLIYAGLFRLSVPIESARWSLMSLNSPFSGLTGFSVSEAF